MRYLDKNPDFVRYFMRTALPDEAFFQTLMLKIGAVAGPNLHVSRHEGARARVLDVLDLRWLRDSDAFFARKFDSVLSATLMDLLDEES